MVCSLRTERQNRADHLGDHVTRLADDDRVARSHIFERDLILVVQCGHAHRGSTDEDGFEHGERRGPTSATDDTMMSLRSVVRSSGGNCTRSPSAARAM